MLLPSPRLFVRCATQNHPGAYRAFSRSLPILSNIIPPESPSYIRLPNPPQSDEDKPARVRGFLPVPREIFPRSEGDRKIKPAYVQAVAPKPAKRRQPCNAAQRWKRTLAESRRKNLRDSLTALWDRRTKSDKIRRARAGRKFEKNSRAAAAPEREDDRLTRTTVLEAMLDTKVYPDPDRFVRAQRSRTEVLARESAKREARRDALMELYINASSFIIQQSELDAEIEKLFSDDYFRLMGRDNRRIGSMENIWGAFDKPHSIARMLEQTVGNLTKATEYSESEYDRSVNRHKRIAEDLTGGRMI